MIYYQISIDERANYNNYTFLSPFPRQPMTLSLYSSPNPNPETHLYPRLRQVYLHGDLLPRVDVGVVGLGERSLQLLEGQHIIVMSRYISVNRFSVITT